MTPTRSLLVLLSALSLAGLALAGSALAQTGPAATVAGADEVVSTAAHRLDAKTAAEAQAETVVAAPAPRPLTTQEQIAAFLETSPVIERGEGFSGLASADPDSKRQVHGSAGVSIGTGGYRSAYVSTLIPIGESATLGLAYSQTDFGKTAAYRPYDAYGYERGRGWDGDTIGYGRSGAWGRGGKRQSVAVSLAVGGDPRDPPEGCAPAFRADDGRYVEPLWATQMRGRDNPCAANGRR
ncbi:MAG: hypothetical protein KKC14_14250 [Alphaproteobacteria bacterium]|nr:hypothetical protein [Alphaproteobacteria bacterium]